MSLPIYLLYLLVLLGLLSALYWIALGKSHRQAYLFACLSAALALLVPIVIAESENRTYLLLSMASGAALGGLCLLQRRPAAFVFSLAPLGFAAYTIAIAIYFNNSALTATQSLSAIQRIALVLVLLCGGLCASGAIVAYITLLAQKSQPHLWWARSNRILSPVLVGLCLLFVFLPSLSLLSALSVLTLLSGATIAGAVAFEDHDMLPPFFNTLAGIAACALGFVLGAAVLLVAGALLCSAGIGFCRTVCLEKKRPFRLFLSSLFGHGSANTGETA